MATRSTISVQNEDGTIDSVYCHFDGYLEGVGLTLHENFNTLELAKSLVALGALSIVEGCTRLAPEAHEEHSFDKPIKGIVVAYHRDRGEDLMINHFTKASFSQLDRQDYNYIFKKGAWYSGNTALTELFDEYKINYTKQLAGPVVEAESPIIGKAILLASGYIVTCKGLKYFVSEGFAKDSVEAKYIVLESLGITKADPFVACIIEEV